MLDFNYSIKVLIEIDGTPTVTNGEEGKPEICAHFHRAKITNFYVHSTLIPLPVLAGGATNGGKRIG